jgi:hypothetical protein
MNTATMALATIEREFKPKPTKVQLLRATAIAISEKRREEQDKLNKQAGALWQRIEKLARKHIKKNCEQLRTEFYSQYYDREAPRGHQYVPAIRFDVIIPARSLGAELDMLLGEYEVLRKQAASVVTSVDRIYETLRDQTQGKPDDVVRALVSDATIKKKLAEAGSKLLSTPTKEDTATAITV